MAKKQVQLCVNCGERPALPSVGTAPLCAMCSPKVNKRGVRMTGEKKGKTASKSL